MVLMSPTLARFFTTSVTWETQTGFLFPCPGDLLDSGIKSASPELAGGFFTTELPGDKGLCVISSSSDVNSRSRTFPWLLFSCTLIHFISTGVAKFSTFSLLEIYSQQAFVGNCMN